MHVLRSGGIRKSARFIVRVTKDGEGLARQTGLLDMRGRPVRGLPAQVVGGSVADAEAAWRGAFLAHGSLTEPGRSSALEVSCPGPEAALALVGAARRLGVTAKAREVRGADRVVIRDGEAIGALLTRMGAHDTRLVGRSAACVARSAPPPTAWPTSTMPTSDAPRARRGRSRCPRRARHGDPRRRDPDHLLAAGQLRVTHRQASLEELGQPRRPADDQGRRRGPDSLTAVDGRQKARAEGIPDTEAAVTSDLLDDA